MAVLKSNVSYTNQSWILFSSFFQEGNLFHLDATFPQTQRDQACNSHNQNPAMRSVDV